MERINSKPSEIEKITDAADQIIKSIINKFNLAIIQADQVKKDCDKLRQVYEKAVSDSIHIKLDPLFPLLQKRSGPVAEHVFSFLQDAILTQVDKLPIIEALLSSRDKNLALKALDNAVNLAEKGTLKVTRSLIQFIADRMDKSSIFEEDALHKLSLLSRNISQEANFKMQTH